MARKWLSGALAFAMIFGCSAPVALAEETPVEVVEQESVEGVEQYAVYAPEFQTSSIVHSGSKDAKSSVIISLAPKAEPDVKVETEEGTDVSSKFACTFNDDADLMTITNKESVAKGKYYLFATYKNLAGWAGDRVIRLTINVQSEDTYDNVFTSGGNVDLTVGEEETISFYSKVNGSKTNTVAAKSISVRKTAGFDDYVSIVDKSSSEKSEFVFKGLKATGDATVAIEYTVTFEDGSKTTEEYTFDITALDAEDKVTRIDVKLGKNPIDNSGKDSGATTVVAQAYQSDKYGDETETDKAQLYWYVNGEKMPDDGVIKNKVGTKLLEFSNVSPAGYSSTYTVKGYVAGTYVITVKDATGNVQDSIELVVTEAPQSYTEFGILNSKGDGFDSSANDLGWNATGATIDLGKLNFGAKIGSDYLTAYEAGASVAYEITNVEYAGAVDTVKYANKIASVTSNGVLTIADTDDAYMDAVIDAMPASAYGLTFTVKVTGTIGDVSKTTTVKVSVGKPSEEAKKMDVYADGVKQGTATVGGAYAGTVTVLLGKTIDFDMVVSDNRGYTDGIDQNIIWELANTDFTDNVYATIDTKTGVVTPVKVSAGRVKVVATSVANGDLVASITINIADDPNATPEPTTTPEPSPTVAPTVAPTEKPAERTGVVVNVSSNLNIRAAATTSSTVVTKVKNGTNLVILGEEGNFYKVQLADGKIGYASKDYVRETTDTPVQPTGDYAIVTTSGGRLNMRQTAGGAVITSIANGTRVDVISEGSEWTLIKYNGRQGYVSTAYLTIYHGAVG